jgi:hypothetical protein
MVGWIFLKLAEKKRVRHSFKTLHMKKVPPRSGPKGTFALFWDRAGTLSGVQERVPRNRNVHFDRNNRNMFLKNSKI